MAIKVEAGKSRGDGVVVTDNVSYAGFYSTKTEALKFLRRRKARGLPNAEFEILEHQPFKKE